MNTSINIREVPVGATVTLESGVEAEIIDNPKDGVWLFARYTAAPGDPALVGQEEMIFAQDVIDVRTQES
jgi:hypothetical protein